MRCSSAGRPARIVATRRGYSTSCRSATTPAGSAIWRSTRASGGWPCTPRTTSPSASAGRSMPAHVGSRSRRAVTAAVSAASIGVTRCCRRCCSRSGRFPVPGAISCALHSPVPIARPPWPRSSPARTPPPTTARSTLTNVATRRCVRSWRPGWTCPTKPPARAARSSASAVTYAGSAM
ncbi:hypothetical protein D3C71_1330080 [compost metagenome]